MNNKRIHNWFPLIAFAAIFAAGLVLPSLVKAQDINSKQNTRQEVGSFPVITLGEWKDSSQDARYGFLIGFATALELEREWQGGRPLPLEQSLNNSWMNGLEGRTFKQISDQVTAYVQANPQEKDRPLVEYLWNTFAQPKVTEKVSRAKFQLGHEIKREQRISAQTK